MVAPEDDGGGSGAGAAPPTVITGPPVDPVDRFRELPPPDWERRGEYGDIRFDVAEGIARAHHLSTRGPQRLPTPDALRAGDAFNVARDDPSVGVVVLTGEGPDAFCSGGDQKIRGDDGYLGDDAVARQGIGRLNVLDLQIQIRRLPKPVVAMVAGYAIGGGHILHLVCDLTIAADNARFGQTGPKVGSFDGGYGASLLARTIGLKRAKEVWFLCRQYDATTAHVVGPGQRSRAAGRPRVRDGRLVPSDAVVVAAGAAHAEGRTARRRRRTGRPPAVRRGRHHALLHERGGPGGPQRLPGAPAARLRPLPPPTVTAGGPVGRPGPPPPGPVRKWLLGARPRTLPAALVPVVVGTAAARCTTRRGRHLAAPTRGAVARHPSGPRRPALGPRRP